MMTPGQWQLRVLRADGVPRKGRMRDSRKRISAMAVLPYALYSKRNLYLSHLSSALHETILGPHGEKRIGRKALAGTRNSSWSSGKLSEIYNSIQEAYVAMLLLHNTISFMVAVLNEKKDNRLKKKKEERLKQNSNYNHYMKIRVCWKSNDF